MEILKRFLGSQIGVCPKTGKVYCRQKKLGFLKPLWFIAGFLSLIWFLVRVIPKPNRLSYPCQRTAAPLAGAFVAWLLGAAGSAVAMRKARRLLASSHYLPAAFLFLAAVGAIGWPLTVADDTPALAALMQPQPPNSPMGVAQGLNPGRVVWTHDPAAATWDGSTGDWWSDDNTDQAKVDDMTSATLRQLTGKASDTEAWQTLFTHFNTVRGQANTGYTPGEKIAIKINMNQDRGSTWKKGQGMPSPHAIYSLVEQLIEVVGVAGADITIYDATRGIGDPIVDKIRSNPSPDFQDIVFAVLPNRATNGRVRVEHDPNHPVHVGSRTAYLPKCVTSAKYLINMALLRAHSMFGITVCGKNHFGSTYFPGNGWTPSPMHDLGNRNAPMGNYCGLVDLNGHEQLGGKTLLYLIDGLYGARNQGSNVMRFESMDNHWSSTLLASQDFIAIDSVAFDILRNEPNARDVSGNPEGYLHEGALADSPPSGSTYDPEKDGEILQSLGVHEHWNNAEEKQYTRNLGTGEGIELVYMRPPFFNGCTADFEPDGDVDGQDLMTVVRNHNSADLAAFAGQFGRIDCVD